MAAGSSSRWLEHARAVAAAALLGLSVGCGGGAHSIAEPMGDTNDAGEPRTNAARSPRDAGHAAGAQASAGAGGGQDAMDDDREPTAGTAAAAGAGAGGGSDPGTGGRAGEGVHTDAGADAAASLCPPAATCIDECHEGDDPYETEAECTAGGGTCYPLNDGTWCRTQLPDPCPEGYHQLENATCDVPMVLPDCLRFDLGVYCAKDEDD